MQRRELPEDITVAIRAHALWVTSSNKEGQPFCADGELDLSNIDFSGARLDEAWLSEVNFDGYRLTDTDFYAACLASATFRNAEMQNCILRKSNLDYSDFSGANLTNAQVTRVQWWHANVRGANLSYADLGGATFRDTSLQNTNLTGASIRRCIFETTDFTGAVLKNVRGLEEVFITSILVEGELLDNDRAIAWIIKQSIVA